jgi:hypothetical protein
LNAPCRLFPRPDQLRRRSVAVAVAPSGLGAARALTVRTSSVCVPAGSQDP